MPQGGLLQKLANDGTWVRFNFKLTEDVNGTTYSRDGTLTMSIVGTTEEQGQVCRWIEFATYDGTDNYLDKLLVPEKYLAKKGAAPYEHVVRRWNMANDQEPKSFEGKPSGSDAWYLAGPGEDTKSLDRTLVESGLGKLECDGHTGRNRFETAKSAWNVTYHVRTHEKAPFGVVRYEVDYDRTYEGKEDKKGHLVLTLAEFGSGAQSVLPNRN